MKRLLLYLAALLFLIQLPLAPNVSGASLTLKKTNLILTPGQRENLRIISGGADNVVWSVDKPEIVRLIGKSPTARGIEALAPGNAVLTVQSGGEVEKCEITVIGTLETVRKAVLAVRGEPKLIPGAFWGVHYGNLLEVGRTRDFNNNAAFEAIRDLGFKNVRGPGGTEANYYMHTLGSVIPYNHPDITKIYGPQAAGIWFTKSCLPNEVYPPYYIKDVVYPAVQSGADYVYNGNVAAYSPQEVVELLKEIRKYYKGKIRYEFGNEIYDLNQSCGFETVEEYIEKCRAIYKAVKEYDSEVEIGVVAVSPEMEERILGHRAVEKEELPEGAEKTQRGRVALWNRTIAENPDFYDAVIIHTYIEVNDFDGFNQDSLRRHFFAYNKYTEDMYPEESELFGGKPIWITEWSVLFNVLLNEQNQEERARLQFMKTPAVAISHADKVLSMLRSGVVEISSYHALESSEGFGVFDTPSGYGGKDVMIKLPNYHVFKALGNMFSGYENYFSIDMVEGDVARVKIPTQLDYTDVPDVGALGFGNGGTPQEAIFINRTENPIQISLSNALISPYWSYGGLDSFVDFLDYPEALYTLPPENVKEPKTFESGALESVVLPPFTMMCARLSEYSGEDGRPAAEANYEYYLAGGPKKEAQVRLRGGVAINLSPPAALVGGKKKEFTEENGLPFIENDRLYLPLRFVAEGLSFGVSWNGEEQSVTVTQRGKVIKLTVGDTKMLIDNTPVTIDAPAKLVGGRVFVPARAIAEGLRKNVFWDERGMVFVGEENNILSKERDEAVIDAILDMF